MDNITHSLVGALTAETALALLNVRKPEFAISKRTKIAFGLSAFFANNICDLDFLWAMMLKPTRLQYLLHHRGHTHTFITLPIQAALIVLLFLGYAKLKKFTWETFELKGIAGLALLGCVLHILLDFLNQYGVHPFWPFYNGWFYADMMFIVEPWIWLTILPLLFFASSHRYRRGLVICLFLSAFALLGWSGFVPKGMATIVGLWSVLLCGVFYYLGGKTRLAICGGALTLLIVVFGLESYWLKKEIKKRFEIEEPGISINDVILSPFPSNPICWQVVTVESPKDRSYFKLRKGVVSIFTGLYRPQECLSLVSSQSHSDQKHPQVIWTTHLKYPREELVKLWKDNCLAAAQLKFVRAPFWYHKNEKLYLADLRFEAGNRGNFSQLEIPNSSHECPKWIPPWSEPRADLLAN